MMDRDRIDSAIAAIEILVKRTGPVSLMEVCGTHTVNYFRSGIRSRLPRELRLVSGPGCPVCVTSQAYLDVACTLARHENVILCTYGDMLRVPGATGSLEDMGAEGADVRVVYSPRDAVLLARANPSRQVVFLAVGFDTTAPGTASAIIEASALNLDNFTILEGHKLLIPAMHALLSAGEIAVDGFILPGHVSVILGMGPYRPIAVTYDVPCVITGFEPFQLVHGVERLLELIEEDSAEVDCVYGAVVSEQGNCVARELLDVVFEPSDALWRAMGSIPASGLVLRSGFSSFSALERFNLAFGPDVEPDGCRCGQVIQGKQLPSECELFGDTCTPRTPVGPCMVSSEGTCAAWFKYGSVESTGKLRRKRRVRGGDQS